MTGPEAARALIDDGACDEGTLRSLVRGGGFECDHHPLAREAARRITGSDRRAIPPLVARVWPALSDAVAEDEAGAALLLCVLRSFLDGRMAPAEVTRRHLAAFERFAPADVHLPYSVIFDADVFGANRDDLLGRYPDRASVEAARLRPWQILLLEWLSGRDYLDAPSVAALWGRTAPGEDADRRSIRTLMLRHLTIGPVPGTPPCFRPLLTEVKAERQARAAPTRPDRGGARLLDVRPWQALQAARSVAAPNLRLGRRPRVAICVSGQLRGHRHALDTWRRRLLPGAETTVFVHAWLDVGRADAQPHRAALPFEGARFASAWRAVATAEGMDAMRARHPSLFAALAHGARADADAIRRLYDTPHVVLEDDRAPAFASISNQAKMHRKIHLADVMARGEEPFDLHVRLRPDLPVRLRGFDWSDLASDARARPVLRAERGYGLHWGNLMIGDQFAIGVPDVMRTYADTWLTFPRAAQAALMGCPADFTGHVSLAFRCWIGGLEVERVPMRFGPLVEAEPLSSRDVVAALEADGAHDEAARRLLDAARADLRGS